MLYAGIGNGYFADACAQKLHQIGGIGIGTCSGSEPWHCDTYNAFPAHAQPVEGTHTDQQSQRGVQTSADADDSCLSLGMEQTLGQAFYLYANDLFTTLVQGCATGHKGMSIDASAQFKTGIIENGMTVDDLIRLVAGITACTCCKRRIEATFVTKFLYVYLTHRQLRLHTEATRLSQQHPLFIDEAFSAEHNILSTFAKAAARIDITTQTTGTLLADKPFKIFVFAYPIIVGT